MNDAMRLFHELQKLLPEARVVFIPPANQDGFWTIEASFRNNEICLEWTEISGFRVSTLDGMAFGEMLDEGLENYESAVRKSFDLLQGRSVSAPNYELSLGQLRERLGFTQKDVADALNVKQPTVSGIERRSDIQISSLYRYVGSMGGRISVKAVFPNAQYHLRFDTIQSSGFNHRNTNDEFQKTKLPQEAERFEARFRALNAKGSLAQANSIAEMVKSRGSILELVA